MKNIQNVAVLVIISYFIVSIIFGISDYKEFGQLTATYLVTQVVMFILGVIINIKYSKKKYFISAIGGGIALMVILQAVLFWLIGDAISSEMSTGKIILVSIIGLVGVRIAFNYFTKDSISFASSSSEFGLNRKEVQYASNLHNFLCRTKGRIPEHNLNIISKTIYTMSTKRAGVKSFEDILFSDKEIGVELLMNNPEITTHSDLTSKLPEIVKNSLYTVQKDIWDGKNITVTKRKTEEILASIINENQRFLN